MWPMRVKNLFCMFRSDKWHHQLLYDPPAKMMALVHRNPSFLDTSSTGQHPILGWRDMIFSKSESDEAICKCNQTSCKSFYCMLPQVDRHNNLCVTKQHVSRNFYQQRHYEQSGTTGTWQPSMNTVVGKKKRKKFPLVHFELLSASGIKKTSSEQKKDLWQVIYKYWECVFPRTSINDVFTWKVYRSLCYSSKHSPFL